MRLEIVGMPPNKAETPSFHCASSRQKMRFSQIS